MEGDVNWHFLFIVFSILIGITCLIAIFWNWLVTQKEEANKFSCSNKLVNYCMRWLAEQKDPGDWNDVPPKDCEKYDIVRPASMEECKSVIK
ncbi:MAG: hypothetical protein QXL86_02205 [Candidatus Aenigmatarchaeota archaeon]